MRRRPAAGDPDRVLLRRAQRVIAVQTAAMITVSLVVVGLLVLIVVARGQRAAAETVLQQTASLADVTDTPPGVWLFDLHADGTLEATRGAPRGFPNRAALNRVHASGRPESWMVSDKYLVLTRRRAGDTVQVVVSLRLADAERHRLLAALGIAELVGLLAAAGSATLLARRATAPLGDALARQRRFVADASHELRTPVAHLHTRAQLLARDLRHGADGAAIADDARCIITASRNLGEVIDDLLLSTQLPYHAACELAVVDLGAVCADVVGTHGPRAAAQGVALRVVPAQEPQLVRGREAALRRVFIALVDNALNHTAAGGHVTIEPGPGTDPRFVQFSVRDDGSGFEPHDAERLFARFARGGPADQRRFGLGLALAREVIAGHGGTIDAAARPGAGAVFTVRLPAAGGPR